MRRKKGTPVIFVIIFFVVAVLCIAASSLLPEELPEVYRKLLIYVGTPVISFIAVYILCRFRGR